MLDLCPFSSTHENMKIPAPSPSLWPTTKAGVLAIAEQWYDPARVALNEAALAALELPPITIGADFGMTAGKFECSLREGAEQALALGSLNYRFWDLQDGAFVRYAWGGHVGAMGMRAAFEAAWADPKSPLNRVRQGGRPLDLADIAAVFGDIPDPRSRQEILNELLTPPTLTHLAQALVHAVEQGQTLDTAWAARLADAFPQAYGDPVLKKAQLAVSEVWVLARSLGLDAQCELTAFADYQIPNILRALGVLTYAPELAARIDAQQPLDVEGPDERALRAASLKAVERIAHDLDLPVAAVDHWLWTQRKQAQTPFHLTFTTAY